MQLAWGKQLSKRYRPGLIFSRGHPVVFKYNIKMKLNIYFVKYNCASVNTICLRKSQKRCVLV